MYGSLLPKSKRRVLQGLTEFFALAPDPFFDKIDAAVEKEIADGAPARSVVLAVALAEGLGVACEIFGWTCDPAPTDPVEPLRRVK